MNEHMLRLLASVRFSLALAVSTVLLAGAQAGAQCPATVTELTSDLRFRCFRHQVLLGST
jgi:hypothetical protein